MDFAEKNTINKQFQVQVERGGHVIEPFGQELVITINKKVCFLETPKGGVVYC